MNFSSPKKLAELLFIKLKLPIIKQNKTGPSTGVWTLEKLRDKHPLIPLLLEHRKLRKLYTTYTDEWINKISPIDGRLHAQILHTGTETGRISMKHPNPMQIPKKGENAKNIRKAICASGGHVLLECDFSQMDLRILAHESQDKELLRAFRNGEDIHDATAKLLGCTRDKAKAVNFGVVYGKTAYGFAKDWDIPEKDAQEFLDNYFRKYWGVKQWMRKIVLEVKKQGYVKTILGRRRNISRDILLPRKAFMRDDGSWGDANSYKRESAERQAWNTICQGGTSDITKVAMIKITRWMPSEMKMLLQVHDSLIFEYSGTRTLEYAHTIKQIMEQAIGLSVPVKVNITTGKDLANMKEVI